MSKQRIFGMLFTDLMVF